jgi:chemotaxis methyl-accepting protein methylase
MQKIFVLLRSRTGHDFSSYKSNTTLRRIERRMNLHQIKGPAHYVRYLQDNPHEIDCLFKELLISVTNFFRDPEAFEALEKSALPALLKSRPDDYTFRVWVPGCATGEELYSLAILIREYLETAHRHCDVQVFGTDLDNDAIEAARNGRYPEGISSDVSPHRLERYFTRDNGTYRIRKDIREMAVFAVQNLMAHRDTLALAAGQLARVAVEQLVQVQDARRVGQPFFGGGAIGAAQLQAEGHVLAHRHVRVQRIALKHHCDVAVLGLQVVDHLVGDQHVAAGDFFQASEHAQQRALAAARRADQHHELAVGDLEADAVDDLDLAVGLVDVAKADRCHGMFRWGSGVHDFTAPAVSPDTM